MKIAGRFQIMRLEIDTANFPFRHSIAKEKGVVWPAGDERLMRSGIGSAAWAVPPFLARRCEGIGLRKGRSPLRREVDDVLQDG